MSNLLMKIQPSFTIQMDSKFQITLFPFSMKDLILFYGLTLAVSKRTCD